MPGPLPPLPAGWTPRQRTALIAIVCVLLAYSIVRYALNPLYVSDPQPVRSTRADELADRIDPNTADEASLAALPTLGEKRAKLIVDYRKQYQSMRPDGVVYEKPEDLLRIRGIGVATLNQIRPFLIFPTTRATTAPTTAP